MSDTSAIEWTDATWNPVTGCTKVSQGCKHCYAERLSARLQAMGSFNYRNGFKLTLQPHMIDLPRRWRGPRRIFVNSMSDLFHKEVPDDYIDRVFAVMEEVDWHVYQVLTKRPERMAQYTRRRYAKRRPPTQIWLGTSVEDERVIERVSHLRNARAATRFLSCEPLIGPLPRLALTGIDWVIVGGESGRDHRAVDIEWVRQIRDRCRGRGVAFFFKQWGGPTPKSGGRVLDGRTWDQMPLAPRRSPELARKVQSELRVGRVALPVAH